MPVRDLIVSGLHPSTVFRRSGVNCKPQTPAE